VISALEADRISCLFLNDRPPHPALGFEPNPDDVGTCGQADLATIRQDNLAVKYLAFSGLIDTQRKR